MINILSQYSSPSVHSLDLNIVQDGMTITVSSGNFRIKGDDYTLSDDFIHEVQVDNERRLVDAFLVVDDVGNVSVAVDERYLDIDGIEKNGIDFTILCWLYRFNIPENVDTLDNVEIKVRKFVFDEVEV